MAFPPPEPQNYFYHNCTDPVTPEGFPPAGRPGQVARLLCYANGGDPQGGFDAYARFAYGRKTGVQTNGMTVSAEFFALIRSPIYLYNDGHVSGPGESLVIEHNYYCGDAHPNEDVAFWELRDGDFKAYDSGVNEGWSPVGSGTIDSEGTVMGTKVGSTGVPDNPSGSTAPGPYPGYSQICWATGLNRWEGWTVLDEMLVLKWDMEGY